MRGLSTQPATFADVQDKLHDISDEGDKQSSAAMATTGQMVNDQGRRRNVAPLVQPLRDGLRTVREIVNRSHKMGMRLLV